MRTWQWMCPITLVFCLTVLALGQNTSHNRNTGVRSPTQILEESRGAVAVILAGSEKTNKLGTGFFLEGSGLLLTNFHVVENAELVGVKLPDDRNDLWAKSVKGFDPENDLAILNVESLTRPIRSLRLGDSNSVRIGEPIVVVSNPEGLEQTVSNGLVSGVRDIDGRKLFQITAPISEGSSGGPVFNQRGEVIGVVVATLKSGQNLNFAIPINYAKPLLQWTTPILIRDLPRRKIIGEDTSAEAVVPDNLPRFWKHTLSGMTSEIRVDGQYLYEEAKSEGIRFKVEAHCETKRDATEWKGKCRYNISWLGGLYGFDRVACSVESEEVITSVTPTRIEGKSQAIDLSPVDRTPAQCPTPGSDWHEFALIPTE